MNITIIGTGYVGLPTGVCMAELGHKVICVDRDENKIRSLNSGIMTLFEEDLEELFHKNRKEKNIEFTTSMKTGIENADLIMIAVGTPPHPITKEADMKYIHAATTELAEHLTGYTVIATKSTVPVATGDDIESLISKRNPQADFDVVSLPEFLREGFAVHDFFHPDRIVIGTTSERAKTLITQIYKYFEGKTVFHYVNRRSSEVIKYASNAFLAMKIHYINEMANFCEVTGADISEVATGMGLDARIGSRFLSPGPGYGGSCFPKDTLAMSYMARQNNLEMSLVNATIEGNIKRKKDIARRILNTVKDVDKPTISILGLAFKQGTDDCRESPAIDVIFELLQYKVKVIAYDPKAMTLAQELLNDKIGYSNNMYDALENTDCLVILTEWDEFKTLDFEIVKNKMRTPTIVDCRNILNKDQAISSGINYLGIGK